MTLKFYTVRHEDSETGELFSLTVFSQRKEAVREAESLLDSCEQDNVSCDSHVLTGPARAVAMTALTLLADEAFFGGAAEREHKKGIKYERRPVELRGPGNSEEE